jgi:hypothetical protein
MQKPHELEFLCDDGLRFMLPFGADLPGKQHKI